MTGGTGYDPPCWPPPGLEWAFRLEHSADVALVLGSASLVWLVDKLFWG